MISWQNHIASTSLSRSFLVVLTTTLLLFVSCGPTIQAFLFSSDVRAAEHHGSSSEDKNKDADLVKVSVVSEAVIPIYKFQIAFSYSFIRTFSFIEKIVTNEGFLYPLPQSNYFRILFRLIISPNAP